MSVDTAIGAVQTAIYGVLHGDSTITNTLGCGVYDDVPDSTATPYITIGAVTEQKWNRFQSNGRDLTITLHIWSRYRGNKETDAILKRVNQLLDKQTLSVSGYHFVKCTYESSMILRDADGITRHCPARFRVLVEA